MKSLCKIMFIAGLLLLNINCIKAQSTETKLDQVELMKQFVGNWRCELGKDTILIGNNISFGNGLVCNSRIVANGKILNSVKQLYGYDKKIDKFIIAELIESSPVIEICIFWFTSKKTGELIITNPENAKLKYKFEFKTPDLIVQTALNDNHVIKEITLTREKLK
jgi:hypothetical protein